MDITMILFNNSIILCRSNAASTSNQDVRVVLPMQVTFDQQMTQALPNPLLPSSLFKSPPTQEWTFARSQCAFVAEDQIQEDLVKLYESYEQELGRQFGVDKSEKKIIV